MDMIPGREAVDLPWLSPCAASLTALATEPLAKVWPHVRFDPGCVLLLVCNAIPCNSPSSGEALTVSFCEVKALQAARNHLQESFGRRFAGDEVKTASHTLRDSAPEGPGSIATGFADWRKGSARFIYECAVRYASAAQRLAQKSGLCEPDAAWIGGLLAPLGWMAMAAVFPQAATINLEKKRSAKDSVEPDSNNVGWDYAEIARRLNLRWDLPDWLATVTGHLQLPAEIARKLGADEKLFSLVQLAVGLVDERGQGLMLDFGDAPMRICERLGLKRVGVDRWCEELLADQPGCPEWEWKSPVDEPLLPVLLRLAVEQPRRQSGPNEYKLHRQIDVLQTALTEGDEQYDRQMHEQKMTAMAEFAAGAAHEINNPLAVISGHAQYLLHRETDPDRRRILEKIIGQTQRISSILTELMHYARPAELRKQSFDIFELIHEVVDSLHDFARERKVQLIDADDKGEFYLHADREKLSKALSCLLRNAVEAAPEGGWAKIRTESSQPGILQLIVEDNGQGPPPGYRDRLFDPFFSGRHAGRGKGLGLPIAWRIAALHDGDVYMDEAVHGLTRFVVNLPCEPHAHESRCQNGAYLNHVSPVVSVPEENGRQFELSFD